MDVPKIKDCPFCGSTADIAIKVNEKIGDEVSNGEVYVECDNCFAKGPVEDLNIIGGRFIDAIVTAVNKWNERDEDGREKDD